MKNARGFCLLSLYQKRNEDLTELMKENREINMEELDKAWTTTNPET
jgi:hypothetical protein